MWFSNKKQQSELSESQKHQNFVLSVLTKVSLLPASAWTRSGYSYQTTTKSGANVLILLNKGGLDSSSTYYLKVDDEEIDNFEIWGSGPCDKHGNYRIADLYQKIENDLKKLSIMEENRSRLKNSPQRNAERLKALAEAEQKEKKRQDVLRRL